MLAQRLEQAGRRAVVLNADSAQVYADLAVLSARPSPEEMGGIEHRLFGAWDGAVPCSAADWAAAAKREIDLLHAEGAVPVLVGGTGLYLRTLLEGIAPVPEIDPAVRATVRSLPVEQAYVALQVEDPDRAAGLAPADSQRIARALEVVRSTGRTLGQWQDRLEGGIAGVIALHPLILAPPREWLFERCDLRFGQMLERGALQEVETLLARELDPALPVMRAIGVPELAAHLKGEISLSQALAAGQLATRQYAKRQYTWFRNQPPVEWRRTESQNDSIESYFASLFQF